MARHPVRVLLIDDDEDSFVLTRAMLSQIEALQNDKDGRTPVQQKIDSNLIYAARMVPEISDRIVEIDRAMRWGYGFALGPFELWDSLGVPETVERMRRDGCAIPIRHCDGCRSDG